MSGREVWLLGTSFYPVNIPAIALYVDSFNRHRFSELGKRPEKPAAPRRLVA
jgi:hypothetical protein